MKCVFCGNTDADTILKLEGGYHFKCQKCGFEIDGTLLQYPNGDWEYDDWGGDIFEVYADE